MIAQGGFDESRLASDMAFCRYCVNISLRRVKQTCCAPTSISNPSELLSRIVAAFERHMLLCFWYSEDGNGLNSQSFGFSSTVTSDFSVFVHTSILIIDDIYWLSTAYILSLYKPYSNFDWHTYNAFLEHIYRVCRIYIAFVQLAPQAEFRVAPSMTTHAVPHTLRQASPA